MIPAAFAASILRPSAVNMGPRVESRRTLRSLARSFVPITMPSNSGQSAISTAFKIPLGVSSIAQIFVFFKLSYLDISKRSSKTFFAVSTFGSRTTSGGVPATAPMSEKPHVVSREFIRTIFVRRPYPPTKSC